MLDLLLILAPLILGYTFGRMAESRHYKSIIKREKESSDLLLIASKKVPEDMDFAESFLVSGNVVVSVDYFKRFLASLRNIFGGRVKSFESLVDRGRREAILRMKQQAKAKDADMIFNIKLETASISKGAENSIGSIEVLAYGTALKRIGSGERI